MKESTENGPFRLQEVLLSLYMLCLEVHTLRGHHPHSQACDCDQEATPLPTSQRSNCGGPELGQMPMTAVTRGHSVVSNLLHIKRIHQVFQGIPICEDVPSTEN